MGDENCRDCLQIQSLQRQIGDLQEKSKDYDKRINELERKSDANEERFKILYSKIDDLKIDISDISEKLDMLASKPSEHWNDAMKTIITVIITAAATYFINLLLKK